MVSSFMWSQVLGVELPDPLPWPLFELIHEDEFKKRIKEVGSPNKQNKEEKNGK